MGNFLRTPELDVTKGINFSVPSAYLGSGQNYPQNVQLYRGELKKRDGRVVVGGVMLGGHKVLHLGVLEISNGTQRLIRHSRYNIERYMALTGLWEDITGGDLTGTETDFFDSCVVTESDLYVFTNNLVDKIKKYDDSGVTQDLGGNPPLCKTLDYVTPYMLIGNVVDTGTAIPQKIQWCDTGNPELWLGGNSGSVLLSDEPSKIQKIKKLLDYAMVYKEKSVYRGRKVASDSIFEFGGPFQIGKGISSPRSIVDNGENHFYQGIFDFHVNNGVRISDIGAPVREYVFNRINRQRIETCFALHVELYKEVWFFVTVGGDDWPKEVWKYNYETGFWYFDTVENCITAGLYKQTGDLTWNTDPGTWDDEIDPWDSQTGLTDAPSHVFGYADGFVDRLSTNTVDDRGVAVNSRIDTKDYTGLSHKGIEYDTRWLQFDIWARGQGSVRLYYSTDYGSNWSYIGTNELTTQAEKMTYWLDVYASHIRFRIQCDGKGEYMTLRNFTPYFLNKPEFVR